MSAIQYLEHLSEADIALLASATSDLDSPENVLAYLRANPNGIEALLNQPSLFAALFQGEGDALLRASPFLVFAVLVHRAAQDLDHVRFVDEWISPQRRVPIFEVAVLQDFARLPERRLFLAELLASYTRVASGSFWIQTSRGWRRRRFSELDPLRLAELVDVLPQHERPAAYRRLGDLSLFLTGVFPDYVGRLFPRQTQRRRLERAVGLRENGAHSSTGAPSDGLSLLELVGRQAYRIAGKTVEERSGMSSVLDDVAEGFGHARRVLNFLTDRYLFPLRSQWFQPPQ
jgi:hypothetical protein